MKTHKKAVNVIYDQYALSTITPITVCLSDLMGHYDCHTRVLCSTIIMINWQALWY